MSRQPDSAATPPVDRPYTPGDSPLLTVRDLCVYYGDAEALDQVSLEVGEGEIVAIVGANGAGKSSLISAIAGVVPPRSGSIHFDGAEIAGFPSYRTCNLGIGQVAEGRQIFPSLSVQENLAIGAMLPRAPQPGRVGARTGVRDVPAARRAQRPECRHALGRRAADARHRPLPDGRA